MYWLRRSYATEGEKVVVLALTACLFSSVINFTETKHSHSRTDLTDIDARETMGLETIESKSHTRKNTRRRHRHKHTKQRNSVPLLKEIDPSLISNLVRFSPTRPHSPPFPYPVPFIDEKEETVLKLAVDTKNMLNNITDIYSERQRRSTTSTGKRKNKNKDRNRRKRSKRREMSVPVCQSTSRWVKRTEAVDLWGNDVKVAQGIPTGDGSTVKVNQFFYETYCRRHEPAPCYGIDSDRFDSVCENKYIWTYARIINRLGEEGWNLIKIPGSCNCALFRKKGSRRGLLSLLR